jgi:hypothetical protein
MAEHDMRQAEETTRNQDLVYILYYSVKLSEQPCKIVIIHKFLNNYLATIISCSGPREFKKNAHLGILSCGLLVTCRGKNRHHYICFATTRMDPRN